MYRERKLHLLNQQDEESKLHPGEEVSRLLSDKINRFKAIIEYARENKLDPHFFNKSIEQRDRFLLSLHLSNNPYAVVSRRSSNIPLKVSIETARLGLGMCLKNHRFEQQKEITRPYDTFRQFEFTSSKYRDFALIQKLDYVREGLNPILTFEVWELAPIFPEVFKIGARRKASWFNKILSFFIFFAIVSH